MPEDKIKIIRVSTVPISLRILLKGQLNFIKENGFEVVGVSSPGEDLDKVLTQENIRVKGIPMFRRISMLKDLKSLWLLYKFFKKEKPTIVHSITPKAGLLSMLAAKIAGVPVRMHTFTGLVFPYVDKNLQRVLIIMDKILCAAATNVYPEGKGVKNDLIQYKITKKTLKLLANGNVNGVDLEHFNPLLFDDHQKIRIKEELGLSNHDFVFVFVGRMVGDKGVSELVLAFERLFSNYEKLLKKFSDKSDIENEIRPKLLLVGAFEPEFDALSQDILNKIVHNPHILNVGFQVDIRPYLSVAQALVLPSYREGFPNVLLQAGAMNLPCIVSDVNGCNEIITHDENGLIVPVKDSETLFKAMELMMQDKASYNKYATVARSNIEKKYSRKLVWDALLEEYRNVLKIKKILN